MAEQFPRNQAGEADSSGMGWRSEDQSLVNDNLGQILNSASYRLAHADEALLESEEMRGVRMLLEITKPQQILDAEGIESTIIIFGGVNIIERSEAEQRLAEAEGVTERFDEFLLLLARRVGLAPPQYVRSNAGKHERDRSKMSAKTTAVIDAATTMDRAAHELAKTIQSRLVAAAGGDAFDRHVKKFQAQSEERGGRVFVGGVPARSPYKWVRESEAKAAGEIGRAHV